MPDHSMPPPSSIDGGERLGKQAEASIHSAEHALVRSRSPASDGSGAT
jgi:hypothetical protein